MLVAFYATAVYTGMRAGEVVGLRWDDIDLRCVAPSMCASLLLRQDEDAVIGVGSSPSWTRCCRCW